MNETNKISIIVPTYNAAATLEKCIESIITQTYKNIEIIIVDGLSTDDTIKISNGYKNNFSFIKVISEKDKGIYDAMNKGIAIAKGDWLFFLGSDDTIFDKNTLQKTFENNEDLIKESEFVYGNVIWGNTTRLYDGEFTLFKIFKQNICHQSIFYKKSIFEKFGMYDLKYPVYADWYLNCLCFFNKKIVKTHIPITIANYSLEGVSATHRDAFIKDRITLFLNFKKNAKLKDKCEITLAMLPKRGFINDTRFYICKYFFNFIYIFLKK